MELRIYHISDSCHLDLSESQALSADWVRDPIGRWADVSGAGSEELRALLEPLKLHPLLMENILDPPEGPRVSTFDDSLYIHFAYNCEEKAVVAAQVSIICLPTTIITIHSAGATVTESLDAALGSKTQLLRPNIQALLFHLLDSLVMRGVPAWHEARRDVAKLAHTLDRDPSSIEAGEILDCKEYVDRLAVLCEDQLFCISSLSTLESEMFRISELRPYFRDLSADLSSAQQAINRLEARAGDLHQHYQLALQNVTNKRLNILTVLSAIYLPATLIAGIYGMNFKYIPILEIRYGYFYVMLFMILLVLGQIGFFWRKGWFK